MKHILVIDDNKTNLVTAKTILGDIYKVTVVISGAQALKYFEKNTCDLILLDINMPEMDGFEVFARLKQLENAKNIPVMFVSANNHVDQWNRCIEEGAVDIMEKPFVSGVMLARIGHLLELLDYRNNSIS